MKIGVFYNSVSFFSTIQKLSFVFFFLNFFLFSFFHGRYVNSKYPNVKTIFSRYTLYLKSLHFLCRKYIFFPWWTKECQALLSMSVTMYPTLNVLFCNCCCILCCDYHPLDLRPIKRFYSVCLIIKLLMNRLGCK